MTTLPEHGWYAAQYADACDDELAAESKWHPRGLSGFSWSALKAQRASREVRDVAAVIDSIIAGTYEAKPFPVPQSLNAAFDSAVRQVRDNARRVA